MASRRPRVIAFPTEPLDHTIARGRMYWRRMQRSQYALAERYERVRSGQLYREGSYRDAVEFWEKRFKKQDPIRLEWHAAVVRHFTVEQATRYSMGRLTDLLRLRQYRGLDFDVDPERIVVRGRSLDGERVAQRFKTINADLLASVVRAELIAVGKKRGRTFDDGRAGIDDLELGALDTEETIPPDLLWPQDVMDEQSRQGARAMMGFLQQKLGKETRVELLPYCRGGETYCHFHAPAERFEEAIALIGNRAPNTVFGRLHDHLRRRHLRLVDSKKPKR